MARKTSTVDPMARLDDLEIPLSWLQAIGWREEENAWIRQASGQELQAFHDDLKAFGQRIGGLPLDKDSKRLKRLIFSGDPVTTARAAALGYYARALIKVYEYRRLTSEPQEQAGKTGAGDPGEGQSV